MRSGSGALSTRGTNLMLKDYVYRTLSQYCFPGCETLVGKTRNHLTQTPHNGVPPHSETFKKPLLSYILRG